MLEAIKEEDKQQSDVTSNNSKLAKVALDSRVVPTHPDTSCNQLDEKVPSIVKRMGEGAQSEGKPTEFQPRLSDIVMLCSTKFSKVYEEQVAKTMGKIPDPDGVLSQKIDSNSRPQQQEQNKKKEKARASSRLSGRKQSSEDKENAGFLPRATGRGENIQDLRIKPNSGKQGYSALKPIAQDKVRSEEIILAKDQSTFSFHNCFKNFLQFAVEKKFDIVHSLEDSVAIRRRHTKPLARFFSCFLSAEFIVIELMKQSSGIALRLLQGPLEDFKSLCHDIKLFLWKSQELVFPLDEEVSYCLQSKKQEMEGIRIKIQQMIRNAVPSKPEKISQGLMHEVISFKDRVYRELLVSKGLQEEDQIHESDGSISLNSHNSKTHKSNPHNSTKSIEDNIKQSRQKVAKQLEKELELRVYQSLALPYSYHVIYQQHSKALTTKRKQMLSNGLVHQSLNTLGMTPEFISKCLIQMACFKSAMCSLKTLSLKHQISENIDSVDLFFRKIQSCEEDMDQHAAGSNSRMSLTILAMLHSDNHELLSVCRLLQDYIIQEERTDFSQEIALLNVALEYLRSDCRLPVTNV